MSPKDGLLYLVLFGGVLSISAGCNKQNPQAAGFQMPPPLVTVTQAVARDVPYYLDEIGKNGAFESVTVTPQVAGRIMERHFEDGADLKKDQLLFVIDPRPYQAQLDAAQASLAQAKAAADLAKIQFDRYAELVGTKAISQQDYDTKKNTVDVDQAQIGAAEAAVETAKLNLEYCYIHSPIDGAGRRAAGGRRERGPGEHDSLLLIQRLDPIYADFTITERDLPEVQQQMQHGSLKRMVRLPSDAENGAPAGKPHVSSTTRCRTAPAR